MGFMAMDYYLNRRLSNVSRGVRKLQFVPFTYNFVKFRSVFLPLALLLIAANCMSASLGRHSGATLVGRPLDVSVRAVLNAQDDVANLCLDADVFYADNRLDKARVRITAEKASAGSVDAVIRIRASVPVDEPVVTVYVRIGCQQKIERRYVMLADMPSEAIADRNAPNLGSSPAQIFSPDPTLPVPASVNANTANANSANANPLNARSVQNNRDSRNTRDARNNRTIQNNQKPVESGSVAITPDVADAGNPKDVRKSVGAKQLRAAAASATGKPAASSGARLKLEPIDLSIEREPQLKSSSQLLSAPATNLQERSAAAALWRAIALPPQDILRDFEKLQNLESSVRSLQAQNQKSQLSIEELSIRLKKAETERYAYALVYALGFLLLLALAALAYILQKQPRKSRVEGSTPWWRRRGSSQTLSKDWTDSGAHLDNFDLNRKSGTKKHKSDVTPRAGFAEPEIDLDVVNSGLKPAKMASGFHTDSLSPLGSIYHANFALSMTHPSRAVKAEELFDVNQQADFFVSIGQHDQAIEVLRNHIEDDVETSVLVYLDLFNLYHQLARKEDYAALRKDFNGRFNTKIPVFELYTVAGPGLEAYQMAMSRIEALWPSPKVLEVIEDSIFNRPENDDEAFNLAAYRELLMLYSVAKEIISSDIRPASKSEKAGRAGRLGQSGKFDLPVTSIDRADSQPVEFVPTSMQPLSASTEGSNSAKSDSSADRQSKSMFASAVTPAFPGSYLDIDLNEPMLAREKRRPNATANAADIEFLKQVESGALGSLSLPATTVHSTENMPDPPGNLIAFDAFNAFDDAFSRNEKPKPPKV